MSKRIYKTIDLFGNEKINFISIQKEKTKNLFHDYEGFLEKFDAKKTTDDCYTPDDVYNIVLGHVSESIDLSDKQIIRPFYPNGDYENIDYPENAIVIDNPPFSIISKIVNFYCDRNIKFYLFAPNLTLFYSHKTNCTYIVADANITYANGAIVNTSFISNLYGDIKIIGDAALCKKFKELNKTKKVNKPKYVYPKNVVTVSKIAYVINRGSYPTGRYKL